MSNYIVIPSPDAWEKVLESGYREGFLKRTERRSVTKTHLLVQDRNTHEEVRVPGLNLVKLYNDNRMFLKREKVQKMDKIIEGGRSVGYAPEVDRIADMLLVGPERKNGLRFAFHSSLKTAN